LSKRGEGVRKERKGETQERIRRKGEEESVRGVPPGKNLYLREWGAFNTGRGAFFYTRGTTLNERKKNTVEIIPKKKTSGGR